MLLLLVSGAGACSAHEASEGNEDVQAVREIRANPFDRFMPQRLAELPVDASPVVSPRVTLTALDEEHVIHTRSSKIAPPIAGMGESEPTDESEAADEPGAEGEPEPACTESDYQLVSVAGASIRPLVARGAWDLGRLSPNGKWVALFGTPEGCAEASAPWEKKLYVAPLTGSGRFRAVDASSRAFEFMGDRVMVVARPGVVHAVDPVTGAERWSVFIDGTTDRSADPLEDGTPFMEVSPDGSKMLVRTDSAAKWVDAKGTAVDVREFPRAAAGKVAGAVRFLPRGLGAKLEVPLESGLALYRLAFDGSTSRLAEGLLHSAKVSDDGARMAFITRSARDRSLQDVSVIDVADLSQRKLIAGRARIATLDLDASGSAVVVTGVLDDSAGAHVCAGASIDAEMPKLKTVARVAGEAPLCELSGDGERVFFVGEVETVVANGAPGAMKKRVLTRTKNTEPEDLGVDEPLGFVVEPVASPRSVLVPTAAGPWRLVQLETKESKVLDDVHAVVAWRGGILYYTDGQDRLRAITSDARYELVVAIGPLTGAELTPSGARLFMATSGAVYEVELPDYDAPVGAPAVPDGARSTGGLKRPPAPGEPASGAGVPVMSRDRGTGSTPTPEQDGTIIAPRAEPDGARQEAKPLPVRPTSGPDGDDGLGEGEGEGSASGEASGCSTARTGGGRAPAGFAGIVLAAFVSRRRRR